MTSIRSKKPILTLVMKDGTPDDFKAGLTTFTRTDAAAELIANNFIFTGFSMAEPPLPAFETLIHMGEEARAVLYFAVVNHEMKVKFMKKIVLSEQTDASQLYEFLTESKSLFEIMAEEDPAY